MTVEKKFRLRSWLFSMLPVYLQLFLRNRADLLYDDAGFGDTLIVAAVARELKNKINRLSIGVHRTKSILLQNIPEIVDTDERYTGIDMNYHHGYPSLQSTTDTPLLSLLYTRVGLTSTNFIPHYVQSTAERHWAEQVTASLSRPIITIQTHSADLDNKRKLWPSEYWDALAGLLDAAGCTILQLGARGEPPVAHTRYRCGEFTIRQSISLVGVADCHIGIVSSLMHAAAAVATPAVIIFGGFERFSLHRYPMVYPCESRPGCSPCLKPETAMSPCDHHKQCMATITPEMLYKKVASIMMLRGAA